MGSNSRAGASNGWVGSSVRVGKCAAYGQPDLMLWGGIRHTTRSAAHQRSGPLHSRGVEAQVHQSPRVGRGVQVGGAGDGGNTVLKCNDTAREVKK